MSGLAWFTEQRLDRVKLLLVKGLASTEYQIGSPAATLQVATCLIEVIDALKGDPGPSINHDMSGQGFR